MKKTFVPEFSKEFFLYNNESLEPLSILNQELRNLSGGSPTSLKLRTEVWLDTISFVVNSSSLLSLALIL